MGSGGASNQNVVEAADILREKSIKRVGPYRAPSTAIVASATPIYNFRAITRDKLIL
jgi:hypothetical protein